MSFSTQSFRSEILFTTIPSLPDSLNIDQKNKIFIIDKRVYALYREGLKPEIGDTHPYLVRATEKGKNERTLHSLINYFIENSVNRDTNIVVIGGGITLDLSAFAASIFKRGCSLTFIPTTFLAMIDAAIGGKTGINFDRYKNLLGSFYPAGRIFIIPELLKSLPAAEISNGWAECCKISLITTNSLYEKILSAKGEITPEIISEAIRLKINFCKDDLTDKGERLKLNLGHTFAHLIESATDYKIPHGLGVALGIRAAVLYSIKKRFIGQETGERLTKPLDLLGFPERLEKGYHMPVRMQGKTFLEMDKKNRKDRYLVLFNGFQRTVLEKYDDPQDLIDTLLEL